MSGPQCVSMVSPDERDGSAQTVTDRSSRGTGMLAPPASATPAQRPVRSHRVTSGSASGQLRQGITLATEASIDGQDRANYAAGDTGVHRDYYGLRPTAYPNRL